MVLSRFAPMTVSSTPTVNTRPQEPGKRVLQSWRESSAIRPASVILRLLTTESGTNHFEALALIKAHGSGMPASRPWAITQGTSA